jgi:hypothetical protein
VLDYLPCPLEVDNYALDQNKSEEKVPKDFKLCCNYNKKNFELEKTSYLIPLNPTSGEE